MNFRLDAKPCSLLLALILTSALLFIGGCGKKSGKQTQDHEPLTEAEYQALLVVDLPNGGPLEHEKLVFRNDVTYYTLTASSGEELHSEIAGKGPSSICNANCSWAYRWNLWWKWDIRETRGTCSVNWINSRVHFQYFVPLWVREAEAPAPLRLRYSEWMRAIWTALNGRTSVILQEAGRLERDVMALPAMACDELDRRIKAEGMLATGRANREIASLPEDEATNRGWMLDY